jgi:co-chaperonin GroES (HSP10)
MQMTDNKILVKKTSEKLSNEIIIPMTGARVGLYEGEVIAIGPGRVLNTGAISPCLVNVGDRIVFSSAGASTISLYIDGKKESFYLMTDVEAALVLDEKERLA